MYSRRQFAAKHPKHIGARVPLLFFLSLAAPSATLAAKPRFCERILLERGATQDLGLWTDAKPILRDWTDKAPETQDLVTAYFRFADIANTAGGLPKHLGPRSLVYLLDSLTLAEQARLAQVLVGASAALRAEFRLKPQEALVRMREPEILAKVAEIHAQVRKLRSNNREAERIALENHDGRGQLYGDQPFSAHLRKVRAVLKRYGLGPTHSILGLRLGTVAWLHDIIEDTPVSYEMLAQRVGKEAADIARALTNEPSRPGLSTEARKRLTFERIARMLESRLVKLADRIANVEESLANYFAGRHTKIEKYYEEWPLFRQILYRPGEAERMWNHLESLLTDRAYAEAFVASQRRR